LLKKKYTKQNEIHKSYVSTKFILKIRTHSVLPPLLVSLTVTNYLAVSGNGSLIETISQGRLLLEMLFLELQNDLMRKCNQW